MSQYEYQVPIPLMFRMNDTTPTAQAVSCSCFLLLAQTTSNAFDSHKTYSTTATRIKLHNERFNDDEQSDQGAVGITRAEFKKCGGVWSRQERPIRHCNLDLQSTQRQTSDIR